jgi:hypothetical protein
VNHKGVISELDSIAQEKQHYSNACAMILVNARHFAQKSAYGQRVDVPNFAQNPGLKLA